MHYCRTVCNVTQKQITALNHRWQILNGRSSNSLLPSKCTCGYINTFSHVQKSCKPGENTSEVSRNFSTTSGVQSSKQGPTQQKERLKNYLVFGSIMITCSSIILGNLYLEKTHNFDRVFIPSSKREK